MLVNKLPVGKALEQSTLKDTTTKDKVKRFLQEIILEEVIVVIIKFLFKDHGIQPYDLFVTQGFTLDQGWMQLSYDPNSLGYGQYMIAIGKDSMDLCQMLQKVYQVIPLSYIEETRVVPTRCWNNWYLPIRQHPGRIYWARDNVRLPACYFKHPCEVSKQFFGLIQGIVPSIINNQSCPGYALGYNTPIMYQRINGFYEKQVSPVTGKYISIEEHLYNPIIRSYVGFMSTFDWAIINSATQKPHVAIQSDLVDERRFNYDKYQFLMNKLSLPNDKLILVNGLQYNPPNLGWERKHTPKDRQSPAKRYFEAI